MPIEYCALTDAEQRVLFRVFAAGYLTAQARSASGDAEETTVETLDREYVNWLNLPVDDLPMGHILAKQLAVGRSHES